MQQNVLLFSITGPQNRMCTLYYLALDLAMDSFFLLIFTIKNTSHVKKVVAHYTVNSTFWYELLWAYFSLHFLAGLTANQLETDCVKSN